MPANFQRELAERVRQLARLQAVLNANGGRPPAEWAEQTAFPFLAAFAVEDVAEFAGELAADLRDASARESLESYEGNLEAWRTGG